MKDAGEADAAYAVDNVYQSAPEGDQVKGVTATAAAPAHCSVKVGNDGSTARTFFLRAQESSERGWSIVYRVGATDITAALKVAGYTTASLAPGASIVISVDMVPTSAAGGSGKGITIKAYLARGTVAVLDALRIQASIPLFDKPDLLIKRMDEKDTAYATDNVYQGSPHGDQVEGKAIDAGSWVRYLVKLENDGGNARSFVLDVREAVAANWRIAYKVGSADITTQIRSASGYTTPVLDSGESLVVMVTAVALSTAGPGSASISAMRVYLDGNDTGVRDTVAAVTWADWAGRSRLVPLGAEELLRALRQE